MVIECQILLPKIHKGFYKSGDIVAGKFKFSIDKLIKVEFVRISLKGTGKCWHSESDSDSSEIGYDSYAGKEQYVSLHKTTLEGAKLQPGDYKLPFQFLLPENLPSSYEDLNCHIKYKIVAVISKAKLFRSIKKVAAEILVFGNVQPCSPQPLIFGLKKCVCTSKKPITIVVEIVKTFLTPGEDIILKCLLQNKSNIPITSIKTKLIAQTTYMIDGKHEDIQRSTVDQSVGECPGIEGNSEIRLTCVVPTLPSLYSIQNSKILIREYKLNLKAKLPFPHTDASVEIPVVIGDFLVPDCKSDCGIQSEITSMI